MTGEKMTKEKRKNSAPPVGLEPTVTCSPFSPDSMPDKAERRLVDKKG